MAFTEKLFQCPLIYIKEERVLTEFMSLLRGMSDLYSVFIELLRPQPSGLSVHPSVHSILQTQYSVHIIKLLHNMELIWTE